jgi:hypothetical protein
MRVTLRRSEQMANSVLEDWRQACVKAGVPAWKLPLVKLDLLASSAVETGGEEKGGGEGEQRVASGWEKCEGQLPGGEKCEGQLPGGEVAEGVEALEGITAAVAELAAQVGAAGGCAAWLRVCCLAEGVLPG